MQLPVLSNYAQLVTRWKSILDIVLASPMASVSILTDVQLINGNTTFNHLLSRNMQGWFIVDINGAATIYRSQPLNNKTLTLTSSAAVTVSIGVF